MLNETRFVERNKNGNIDEKDTDAEGSCQEEWSCQEGWEGSQRIAWQVQRRPQLHEGKCRRTLIEYKKRHATKSKVDFYDGHRRVSEQKGEAKKIRCQFRWMFIEARYNHARDNHVQTAKRPALGEQARYRCLALRTKTGLVVEIDQFVYVVEDL